MKHILKITFFKKIAGKFINRRRIRIKGNDVILTEINKTSKKMDVVKEKTKFCNSAYKGCILPY